jgi:hypothetical protein
VITVTSVSGGAAGFSGEGYVTPKLLGSSSIGVTVEFSNIKINPCYQLIQGSVKTKYDPTWSNVVDVDAVVNAVQKLLPELKEWILNFKGTPEDKDAAKYYKEQIEAAKAALLADPSLSDAEKADMLAGYDQQLAGLNFIVTTTDPITCDTPIDTDETESLNPQSNARLAADGPITTICQAVNSVYQGASKAIKSAWQTFSNKILNCLINPAAQDGGIVPKCLWNHNLGTPYSMNDAAFLAGFVDGLYATAADAAGFVATVAQCAVCLNASPPLNPGFNTETCIKFRAEVVEVFELLGQIKDNKEVRDKAWAQVASAVSQMIDETFCNGFSNAECRYRHGRLAFEVLSIFVPVTKIGTAAKAGIKSKTLLTTLKYLDDVNDQIKIIHRAIHGLGGKFVKTVGSGAADVIMKSGQKVFKCTNGVLSEIRWKTGSGWIESKVLYGVDYINSTGTKVKNGVLKLFKRTNCRLSADAADDACDWAVEGVNGTGLKKFVKSSDWLNFVRTHTNIEIQKWLNTLKPHQVFEFDISKRSGIEWDKLRNKFSNRVEKVYYDCFGFPNFVPFVLDAFEVGGNIITGQKAIIEIDNLTGCNTGLGCVDFKSANEKLASKLGVPYQDFQTIRHGGIQWTWHHHQDGKTMMLIPFLLNSFSGATHIGGSKIIKVGDSVGQNFRGMLPSYNELNTCK